MYGYVAVTVIGNGKVYVHQHKWDNPGMDDSYHGSGKVFKVAFERHGMEDKICLFRGNSKTMVDYAEKFWIKIYGGGGYDFRENYNILPGPFGGKAGDYFVFRHPDGKVHAGVGKTKFIHKFRWDGARTMKHPQSDWEILPLDYDGEIDEFHS